MGIIVKPLVTEKVTKQSEMQGRYTFVVEKQSNKIEIKDAVEQLYGVKVVSVNTMNYSPKRSVKYTKSGLISGKKPSFKKAVVQVSEGEVIDFYSNI